jgi:serine/threonine protein kinase
MYNEKGACSMGERVGEQFGNYRLTRLLGEGGFAEVYLGEHIHLGSQVAIKVLHTKLITRDQEAFIREARMIAALEHPGIVRVLDCGIERSVPYLVMNYAPHGTLRQCHPKGTIVPLDSIVSYVQQVASALQYAHEHKLIHRDIKPENMLLGRNQEVLLSDFGIAVISSSSSSQSTKATAGTAAYMAPEQFLGKPCPASDQYSLGVVVYEWLSGDRPFHGTFLEMSGQHLHASPPPLAQHGVNVSPEIADVVMKALSKDPEQRFAAIQGFATALDKYSRQEATLLITAPTQQPPSPDATISLAEQDEPALRSASSIPTTMLANPNLGTPNPPPVPMTSKSVSNTKKPGLQAPILIALILLVIISSIVGVGIYLNQVNASSTGTAHNATSPSNPNATSTVLPNKTATSPSNTSPTPTTQPSPTATSPSNNPTPTTPLKPTATVSANSYPLYLPGSGTLAFADALNQEGNWISIPLNIYGGACLFTGGAYHISKQNSNSLFMHCYNSEATFSNFTFEVQLTITQGDCGGMTFREASNNRKFYYFIICQNGGYVVRSYIDSSIPEFDVLQSSNSSAIKSGLGQQNKIAVVANGNTMILYVNEQQIAQIQDSNSTSGYVGLVADPRFGNTTDVGFSNAKVWTL